MIRALYLVAALCFSFPAVAQEGTVRIVIGFPAGASLDILTRLIAEHMRVSLNQAVIVENRTGAGGQLANEAVKAAAPDGNTLLLTPIATMGIYPHSYAGKLRYDPLKDFAPVTHVAAFQLGIGVGAQVPANTLAEYVALVKKDPKTGFYASAGAGSIPHFLGVMLARSANIEMTHVPYKGTAPVLQALAAGEISAATLLPGDIATLVKAGKARMLATSGAKRSLAFPDVPTFKESGYDLEAEGWYAMFAPAGIQKPALDRVSGAAIAALADPVLRGRLEGMGLEPTGYPPERLGAILKADYDKWGPVIRASGFKPD